MLSRARPPARRDRSAGDLESRRDFGHGELLELVENEDGPKVGGQRFEEAIEEGMSAAIVELVSGVRPRHRGQLCELWFLH